MIIIIKINKFTYSKNKKTRKMNKNVLIYHVADCDIVGTKL